MENLKSPAHPVINDEGSFEDRAVHYGFTKLELASLMIAQAYTANPSFVGNTDEYIAEISVKFAKAVLEEANK